MYVPNSRVNNAQKFLAIICPKSGCRSFPRTQNDFLAASAFWQASIAGSPKYSQTNLDRNAFGPVKGRTYQPRGRSSSIAPLGSSSKKDCSVPRLVVDAASVGPNRQNSEPAVIFPFCFPQSDHAARRLLMVTESDRRQFGGNRRYRITPGHRA